jgi:aryl-alcohol dehydrogenase-like predicted oxidoreductase
MLNRILGNNHLTVSSMGLGCWGMSHAYGKANEKESLATINQCLDLGINFLDTADVYGDGHNERLIAKVLKHRRQEAVVGTKFGFVGDEHGNVAVNGKPAYVQSACEKSLLRLGIDEIDLYYFHRLDPDVPIEETVGAMVDLINQGKIRYIGLSEVSAITLKRAHAVHPITALQSEYSLWHRSVEKTIFPACKELNVSLIPFSPLGRGFLTGTILQSEAFAADDYRRQIPRFDPDAMKKNQFLIGKLKKLAKNQGVTPSQLSLAWLLAQDEAILPIPGMKQRKYIEENLGAIDLLLPDNVLKELNNMETAICGERHNKYNLRFIDDTADYLQAANKDS